MLFWFILLSCIIPSEAKTSSHDTWKALSESTMIISKDDPIYNLIFLVALGTAACMWDWLSSPIRIPNSPLKVQKRSKNRKKNCITQTTKMQKAACMPKVHVAFAGRTQGSKRLNKARLRHRRIAKRLYQERLLVWLKGHNKSFKQRTHTNITTHALPRPIGMAAINKYPSSVDNNYIDTAWPMPTTAITAEYRAAAQPNNEHQHHLPSLRQALAGGAAGAATTARKQWQSDTTRWDTNPDQSLAQALSQVLQQWQQPPTHHQQGWQRKRHKQQHNWNSNSTSLKDQLLTTLNSQQHATDQQVAHAIAQILQPYLPQETRRQYQPKLDPDHAYNRWSHRSTQQRRQSPNQPATLGHNIKGLITSEWTKPPVLREANELLNDIKQGSMHDTANIAIVTSSTQATNIQATWKAYGTTGSFTLLLTGPARSTPGATPTRVRIIRGGKRHHHRWTRGSFGPWQRHTSHMGQAKDYSSASHAAPDQPHNDQDSSTRRIPQTLHRNCGQTSHSHPYDQSLSTHGGPMERTNSPSTS